jgi:ubiquitin carboxyl-terminal hydrolase 5/13
MQNLGNSCYMASVMQTLFMVPEFQARFYKQRDALLQQLVRF